MSIIAIKQYSINGGLDMKFEEEFPAALRPYVKEDAWDVMIRECNRRLMKNRCKKKDVACLVAAPACLITLVPFMLRYKKHQKRSKMIMIDTAAQWNEQHPLIRLKYDRHSAGLVFHLRTVEDEEEAKSPALNLIAKEQEILRKQRAKTGGAPVRVQTQTEADDDGSESDEETPKNNKKSDETDPWASLANN